MLMTQAMAELPTPPAPPTRRRRVRRLIQRHSVSLYAMILMILLAMMLLAPRIFIIVPAGHVGVLWRTFMGGTVTSQQYGEGLHMILPWNEMLMYDTRLQKDTRIYDTISSNGLSMQVEIAVRYRLDRDSAGLMHKLIGPNYPNILVYPEIGSHARELISRYTPEQLYTETRAFIQAEILERMVTQLGSSMVNQDVRGKMLHIEDVLIRSIQLPARVAEAIERKAEQQQMMLEYDFRIAREQKERERKRIEAEGVRDFQSIVARTITDEYLRLRGIEATTSLATSNNSKMIIIGGRDGLPLILNTGETPDARPMREEELKLSSPAAELDRQRDQAHSPQPNARPDQDPDVARDSSSASNSVQNRLGRPLARPGDQASTPERRVGQEVPAALLPHQ